MKNIDMNMHVQGKSLYVNDLPEPAGLLHAAIFTSPTSKGIIKRLDTKKAEQCQGVSAIITGKDIPGENQIGHIIQDQPLLAENEVGYIGQPIAIVIAETKSLAVSAFKDIELEIEELTPITDPRVAYKKGELIQAPRIMAKGNVESIWETCSLVVEGRAENGGQEHFYFETQGSMAVPQENDSIKVYASAQGPGSFHHAIADVLDLPMHKIELEIRRLGGAFGGKESNATWTVLSAVAANHLNKPVKLILNREEDIKTSGKRHPYSSDFKIGFNKNGKILAYEAVYFQSAGAFADISTPVLERSMLHSTASYAIPNVRIKAISCRTNIVPNTAFRGFGAPQAMYALECALFKSASIMGIEYSELQQKNLLNEGDTFPFGMAAENCNAKACWKQLNKMKNIHDKISSVREYNKNSNSTKKGIAVIPVCFGVSFTQTALNQANSLVHIYTDGSVAISTGAVEMGQGVNMKIALIAATTLGINPNRVKVQTTNSLRVANASPTAASTGADLNGMATKLACTDILTRFKKFISGKLETIPSNIKIIDEVVYENEKPTSITWNQLVTDAYWGQVGLSSNAYYATPKLHFDRDKEKGCPFAYHAYGTSVTEVTIDTLRGTYTIDSVNLVHDVGNSLSKEIDLGQIEGALIQAIGWSTIENIVFDNSGRMLTSTNSYKIPDIKFIPEKTNIEFLKESKNPYAVFNSKAVGEPPFIHGIAAYFALADALKAARPDKETPFSLPMTPEKVLMHIHE